MTTREDDSPVVRPRRWGSSRTRPLVVGELVVVVALLVVYDRVRALAEVHASVAIAHGWAILDLERTLHLQVEGGLNTWLSGQGFLRLLAVDYYQYVHVTVALGVLVACYWRSPAAYRPARNALLLTNLVGLAVFAFYPAAPPRLLPGGGFVDLVAQAGFGTSHGPVPADQYGALPSLHLAWATWVAVTGFALTRRRVLRVLLVAHPVVTGVVVLVTGNHYVLDVASGTLLGLAAVWATGLLALGVARPGVLVPAQRPTRLTPSPVAVVLEPRFPEPRPLGAWSLEAESPEP